MHSVTIWFRMVQRARGIALKPSALCRVLSPYIIRLSFGLRSGT
jgi:hypothetical protein